MSATTKQLRDAIATAVDGLAGLRATSHITDQVNAPQAMVWRKGYTFDDTMHGPAENAPRTILFGVRVYAGRVSERAAQDLLDDLAEQSGAATVKQVVETNSALDALCDWVLVKDVGDVTIVTVGAIDYLAEDFNVEIGVS